MTDVSFQGARSAESREIRGLWQKCFSSISLSGSARCRGRESVLAFVVALVSVLVVLVGKMIGEAMVVNTNDSVVISSLNVSMDETMRMTASLISN